MQVIHGHRDGEDIAHAAAELPAAFVGQQVIIGPAGAGDEFGHFGGIQGAVGVVSGVFQVVDGLCAEAVHGHAWMGLAERFGAFFHTCVVGLMVVGAGLADAEHLLKARGEHVGETLVDQGAAAVGQQGAGLAAVLYIGLQGAQVRGHQGGVGPIGVTAQGGQSGGVAATQVNAGSADHGLGGAALADVTVRAAHPLTNEGSACAVDRKLAVALGEAAQKITAQGGARGAGTGVVVVVYVAIANALGGELLQGLWGGADDGAAVQMGVPAHREAVAAVPGKQAALVTHAGIVLGGMLVGMAEGGVAAEAPHGQGTARAVLVLPGAGAQGVLEAGDVQLTGNGAADVVGGDVGAVQLGVAAGVEGGGAADLDVGIHLGDRLLAGLAFAPGPAGTETGAGGGHAPLGAHAAAAVTLAGGLLLGALGAVQDEVTGRVEEQAGAADLGADGVKLASAFLAFAFFVVAAKGVNDNVAAGPQLAAAGGL